MPTKTRPGWVWFICIWYTLPIVVTALLIYLLLSGSLPLTPQGKASLAKLTTFDYVFGIVQLLLALSAAVTLFQLRRQATYFFWVAFGVGIASNVYYFVLNDGIRAATWTRLLIYFGIQFKVCVYCEVLKKEGTLT